MTVVLDAARRELQRGRQPIPIPLRQKRPIMDRWPDLRLNQVDLSDHFQGPANLGVLNGAPSGNQIDVDLDCREALVLADAFLPPTRSVFGRLGKPRSHRLYIAEPLPITTQFRDTNGTMLVEVRSTGTQTIFPPSIHASGEVISWEEDGDPGVVSGDVLMAAAKKIAAASLLARRWPEVGGRHDAALALAGGLSRAGWSKEDVAAFIKAVANTAGDEEMHNRAAAALCTADRLAEDRTATGWNRLGQYVGTDVLNRVRSWLGPTNSENTENSDPVWEVPIPLTELPRPPFPTDIFPNWVRAYVEAVAAATQTPPDLAAMLVLAALAAACSKRVIVQITSDWSEPVNLFIVTAMASGERKSAVFQEVTQPIMAFEVSELTRLAPLIAEAESRRKIAEQALAKAQRDAAHATGSEHASLLTTADALAREIAAMKVTAPPRLVVDDCSPERLASLLAEQHGRIAVMAPEGDVFDLMAGRYSATGMPNFGVYLRSHAGDDLRVDRVGRPSEVVRSPALTMGLAVQPEVIRGLTTHPGFRGRGLLGRPLYALPESLIGRRASDPPAVPVDTRSTYHRNLTALLKMEPDTGTDEWGHPKPRRLALSAEAAARFRTFRTELEPRLGELGDLGDIRDWAGKLAGAVARIAGLLHIAEYTDQSTPWSEPISDDTICAAIRLGQEFLIPHAQAAFAQMGADPAVADAQHVLRVLADRDLEQFTKRDLFQVVKGRFKSVEPLGRALTVLEDHGYIRARPEIDRPGPGRRPSPTFDVNPLRRPDRTNTFGQPSTDPPSDRPEDAGFSARELTLAQNAHNSQNALLGDCEQDCEDSEDCEEPATQQEIMEWAAAL